MASGHDAIDAHYSRYYASKPKRRLYPTEFVVRTFLANYPNLDFPKPNADSRVLDVGFGDGRNTVFLCDQGFNVSGIEISPEIVQHARGRLEALGHTPNLQVGRNSTIPFADATFDIILACHCCYYCDEHQTLADNLSEYARVLKPGGWLVASIAHTSSYIFRNAEPLPDGTFRILADPYGNRNGYRLQAFNDTQQLTTFMSPWFSRFSVGLADNDYYGIAEKVFWVTCQRNLS